MTGLLTRSRPLGSPGNHERRLRQLGSQRRVELQEEKPEAASSVGRRAVTALDRHSSEDFPTFLCGRFPSNKENSVTCLFALWYHSLPTTRITVHLLSPTCTCLILRSSTPLSSDKTSSSWSDQWLMKGLVRTGTLRQCMSRRTGSTRCSSDCLAGMCMV